MHFDYFDDLSNRYQTFAGSRTPDRNTQQSDRARGDVVPAVEEGETFELRCSVDRKWADERLPRNYDQTRFLKLTVNLKRGTVNGNPFKKIGNTLYWNVKEHNHSLNLDTMHYEIEGRGIVMPNRCRP